MVSNSPRLLPGSALAWGLTVFFFVVTISAPGVLYATLGGQRRTTALTWAVIVEAVLVVAVGLFLRRRTR